MFTYPKLLRAYYKGSEQRIKVYDGTPETSIIETIKKSFHITENNSKIYLQDDEGDIIVIPPIIPDNLCVYVYVEPSLLPIPSNQSSPSFLSIIFSFFWPETQQDESSSNEFPTYLPGFRWKGKNVYDSPCITNDGYTLSNKSSDNAYPWYAISTTSYEYGRLFVKINVKLTIFQKVGIIQSSFSGSQTDLFLEESFPQMFTTSIVKNGVYDRVYTIGIFVDMDNKIVKFCEIVNDEILVIATEVIPEAPIKIFGWTKENEMTILEEGSSPTPAFL